MWGWEEGVGGPWKKSECGELTMKWDMKKHTRVKSIWRWLGARGSEGNMMDEQEEQEKEKLIVYIEGKIMCVKGKGRTHGKWWLTWRKYEGGRTGVAERRGEIEIGRERGQGKRRERMNIKGREKIGDFSGVMFLKDSTVWFYFKYKKHYMTEEVEVKWKQKREIDTEICIGICK